MRFEIPQNVSELSDEELNDAISNALDEGRELSALDEHTDEQVSELEKLASFVQEAREESSARETAAQERQERLSAAKSEFSKGEDKPKSEDPDDSADPADDSEQSYSAESEATDSQDSGEELADDSEQTASTEEDQAGEQPAEDNEDQKETVVASSNSAVERVAQNAASPDLPKREPISIVAGAEVPNKALGQQIGGIRELGEAFVEKFKAMSPSGMQGGQNVKYNVATMTLPRQDDLVATSETDQDVFTRAASERRLEGGSLAAARRASDNSNALVAAGWCAPSETLYDLCDTVATDGLYTLPEVQVNRGGIRYTKAPDVSNVDITQIGFRQTEAQAEAGETKSCEEIECATFDEARLDATGICIKAGLLQVAAYPELVDTSVQQYLSLYQHRYSLDTLNEVSDLIGTANTLSGVWESAISLLNAVELVAEGYRQDNFLALDDTLEVVLPHWTLPALRADFAGRTGVDDKSVTDAQLVQFFLDRKISPQFVRHYQPLDTSSGIATTYPTTLEFMMYPAGSYVRGVTDVIRLGTIYDAASLQTNTYTELFAETGMLVAEMCNKGKKVQLPFSVTGRTSAADIVGHFTTGS